MVNWKYIFIAFLVIVLLVALWIWMRSSRSLSFDFNLGGNVADLLGSIQGRYSDPVAAQGLGLYVEVPLTTIIKNKGAAATVLSNIFGSISYEGQSIIQTKPNSTVLQSVAVAGKSSTPVTDNVQVLINPASIKFLSELAKGNKPPVKYNFGTTILGKPYQFSNNTTINNS